MTCRRIPEKEGAPGKSWRFYSSSRYWVAYYKADYRNSMGVMKLFKVIDKLFVGNIYCVSVEGDTMLLKNGLELTNENGESFIIQTVGMPHYRNVRDGEHRAEVVLSGNVECIGEKLFLRGEA